MSYSINVQCPQVTSMEKNNRKHYSSKNETTKHQKNQTWTFTSNTNPTSSNSVCICMPKHNMQIDKNPWLLSTYSHSCVLFGPHMRT